MSVFDRINKADVFGSGRYFPVGNFNVTINAVKLNSGHKGDFFIIECVVDDSDTEEIKPGNTAAQLIKLSNDNGPGNVKEFLAIAFEQDPKNSDVNYGELAEKVTGDENPMAGMKMQLETFIKLTKAGNDFTVHKWTKI